jgi:hypothetical protein
MVSTLVRLPYTPLRDLLRGRVTARLDWRGVVADSGAPPEIQALLERVIGQKRLWRSERADLAAELLDHFFEAIEEGETDSEFIARFGDPDQAAALVCRSKIRSRPTAWHLLRWTCWLLAIGCIFYAGVAVRYYTGRPTPAVNFTAAVNAQVTRPPEGEAAWPIYESARASLGADETDPLINFNEYDEHWPQTARWIDGHQKAVESVLRGSSLRVLGLVLGLGVQKTESGAFALSAGENLARASVPQLQDLRILGNLLACDARRARERGDGQRLEADIAALDRMALQVAGDVAPTVGQVFSLDLLARCYDELDRTLIKSPRLLDDAAPIRITQRISVPQTGSDLINFRGERLYFEGLLQRTFTNNGQGDGRFSTAGWNFCAMNYVQEPAMPAQMLLDAAPGALLQPASMLFMGSRKDQSEEFDRLMDLNDAMIRVPLREADTDGPAEMLRALSRDSVLRWRYALLLTVAPALERPAELAERTLGQRDGLLVGLALEMYRRMHDRYPDNLEQLMPGFLPTIPADRITGDPLKYRLTSGKPLVYSVGVDRVDDGGRVPVRDGLADPDLAAKWGKSATVVGGDWVLYPKPRIAGDGAGD